MSLYGSGAMFVLSQSLDEEEDTCDIQPPFFSGILPLLVSMRTQRVPNV